MMEPKIYFWIKTPCGRSKYTKLAAKPGLVAKIRLCWLVLIAAIRDWNLTTPDQ